MSVFSNKYKIGPILTQSKPPEAESCVAFEAPAGAKFDTSDRFVFAKSVGFFWGGG